MSEFMMKLFGLKKKNEVPSVEEAIKRLRNLEEILLKKTDFLEKKIEEQMIIAKKNGTTNKRVALKALKTKKKCEKQLQQIDNTLSTIEYQRESLQDASVNAEVLNVMTATSRSLQQVHNSLNVESIEDLMEKIEEQQEVSKDIWEAMSRPLGGADEFDEEELLEELEEMEQRELTDQLVTVDTPIHLPSVPQNDPLAASVSSNASTKSDEDELKELAEWAN